MRTWIDLTKEGRMKAVKKKLCIVRQRHCSLSSPGLHRIDGELRRDDSA